MNNNNDYSWVTEVHSLMEPDFLEAYMTMEATSMFFHSIGDIIKHMIDTGKARIISLEELEKMIIDDDEEEVK